MKRINENLESIVKERTATLKIQNRALELSRAILEDIPWPVIGISNEMIIVLINISAQSLSFDNKKIEVGKRISNYFPSEIVDRINFVITNNRADELWAYKLSEILFNVAIAPSSGSFRGKGAVMTLTPA